MIDIDKYIEAQKLSWLRRIFLKEQKYFAIALAMYPFLRCFQDFGSEYFRRNVNRISNPFWRDVFNGYKNYIVQLSPRGWFDFLLQPLWYNPHIKVGGACVFYKQWYNRGVINVCDLMDRNGNLLSQEQFQLKYAINCNFLQHAGICESVRDYLGKFYFPHFPCNISRPYLPVFLVILLKTRSGSRPIYDQLIKKDIFPKAATKWTNELNVPDNYEWSKTFSLPYSFCKDSNMLWFQLRITHRILATNHLLEKMKIMNTNLCSFCNEVVETLVHLFCRCAAISNFWISLVNFINNKCNLSITPWSETEIIFGILQLPRKDMVRNKILLCAKYFIYKCRLNKQVPSLNGFKRDISNLFKTEKYIAVKNDKLDEFNKQWELYKKLLLVEGNAV